MVPFSIQWSVVEEWALLRMKFEYYMQGFQYPLLHSEKKFEQCPARRTNNLFIGKGVSLHSFGHFLGFPNL